MKQFLGLLLGLTIFINKSSAQSIKEIYTAIAPIHPGEKLDVKLTALQRDSMSGLYPLYQLRIEKFQTLYYRSIKKILVQTTELDTIKSISVFLSHDTTLHRQMEFELGPPEKGWMAFSPEADNTDILWTRFWDLGAYTVEFRDTKYDYLLGTVSENYLVVSILPKRKKK